MTDDEYEVATRAALMVQNRWILKQEAARRRRVDEEQATEAYLATMGYAAAGASTAAERALQEEEEEEEGGQDAAATTAAATTTTTTTAAAATATAAAAATATATAAASQASANSTTALIPAVTDGDIELGTAGSAAPAAPAAAPAAPAAAPTPAALVRKKEVWKKPTLEVAQAYADARHPRKYPGEPDRFSMMETTTGRHCCIGNMGEQCDLFGEGQVSEFGQFGSGVTTYFKFLKWNIWVFFFLGLISLVPVLFNMYGPTEQTAALDSYLLTTAGNLASTTNSSALINIPGCVGYDYNGLDCTITPAELAGIYAYLDLGAMIFMLMAYIWLRVFERKETLLLDQATVNVSDFSVRFSNLPKECTTEEFKQHIAKVTNSQVAAVYFAYDNHHEIEGYRRRGKLVQEKYHIRQQKLYHEQIIAGQEKGAASTCGPCCGWSYFCPCSCRKDVRANELELWASLDERNAQLGGEIKAMNIKLEEETHSEPLFAFVTFEEKIGALVAKSLYTVSWFSYICMEAKHKFKGHRLKVSKAPEPSTIIWENLNFTHYDRMKRRWKTGLIAFALIFISFFARLISTIVSRAADSSAGNGVCPDTFADLSVDAQHTVITENSDLVHCYCGDLPLQDLSSDPFCKDYFDDNVRATGITYGASFMMVAINMSLEIAVRIFADYEKHHSIDSKAKSIFKRLFWLYVVNNAAVFIIQINTSDLGFIQQMTGYTPAESLVNFTADWYAAAGGSIIIVQVSTALAIQGGNLFAYWRFRNTIQKAHEDPLFALTQDELNLLHLGPMYQLSVSYAQHMSTFFVCLFFSMGIPVLYPIACLSFITSYFVEKYLFINYYRTPPRYNSTLAQSSTRMIPLAIVAHLIFSIWTLSIDGIFNLTTVTDDTVTSSSEVAAASDSNGFIADVILSVTTVEVFPLFVLLIIVVAALVLEYLAENFFGGVSEAFVAIFGDVCSKWTYMAEIRKYNDMKRNHAKTKSAITYSRAQQRSIFKGLSTYNILQNPFYLEAFSISSKFASEHTSVNSLKFNKKQLNTTGGPVPTKASVSLSSHIS